MMVQTSKGKVPRTLKELMTRIITFVYEKLLLLNSSRNKVTSNIAITGKKRKTSQIYMTYNISQSHFEVKLLILQMSPVVQCDVPTVRNTSLYDDNDDDK